MRCYICSWADFSGQAGCLDQAERMKGRNAVHWRKGYHSPERGEFICNVCWNIAERNRRLYLVWNGKEPKLSFRETLSTIAVGPYEAYKRKLEFDEQQRKQRSEQENKEVTPALSET